MKRFAWGAAVLLASACGDGPAVGVGARSVGPSPLPTFDQDRLWILLHARGDANMICREYYRGDAATREALKGKCGEHETSLVAYLRLNGLPTLEPEHLRDGYYMNWVSERIKSIYACQMSIPVPPLDNLEKQRACDPWAEATVNRRETIQSLGIVFPPQQ